LVMNSAGEAVSAALPQTPTRRREEGTGGDADWTAAASRLPDQRRAGRLRRGCLRQLFGAAPARGSATNSAHTLRQASSRRRPWPLPGAGFVLAGIHLGRRSDADISPPLYRRGAPADNVVRRQPDDHGRADRTRGRDDLVTEHSSSPGMSDILDHIRIRHRRPAVPLAAPAGGRLLTQRCRLRSHPERSRAGSLSGSIYSKHSSVMCEAIPPERDRLSGRRSGNRWAARPGTLQGIELTLSLDRCLQSLMVLDRRRPRLIRHFRINRFTARRIYLAKYSGLRFKVTTTPSLAQSY
jgi:hypothetical protein